MHCHCGTNHRAPRYTFTDPCKPEVRPGAREESEMLKNNEYSDKVWFDYSVKQTNTLDLYLIGIVTWWVFDSKSVNLAIYMSTVAIVCIGKYREVECNESIIDPLVLWIILI